MTVTVWSERRRGGWDQCSECGYLMGLVHGGFTKFPLKVYTNAERDALTAAEVNREASRLAGKAMFPLIDAAALKRYGKRLRSVTGSTTRATDAQLRTALTTAGNAVVLPGTYVGLGYNHPLRARARQANGSDYKFGHMVTVVNRSGSLFWLDPLRVTGEAAYPCTVNDALAFAFPNNDAHVVRANEFGVATLPDAAMAQGDPMLKKKFQPWKANAGGTPIYETPNGKLIRVIPAGTELSSSGETLDGVWRSVLAEVSGPEFWVYAKRSTMTPLPPPPATRTTAGDPAYDQAVTAHVLSRIA